jgi:hypothetical protein
MTKEMKRHISLASNSSLEISTLMRKLNNRNSGHKLQNRLSQHEVHSSEEGSENSLNDLFVEILHLGE